MEESIITSEDIRKFQKFKKNFETVNSKFKDLQEHVGQYVAVGNGRILEYSNDKNSLINKFKHIEGLYVDLVTPENVFWIL